MTVTNELSIGAIYDDLTADSDNDKSYYDQQPEFWEFCAIHEKLVREFGHNALIGNWATNPVSDHPDTTTTDILETRWEKITTWYDIADYMDDWVWQRIKSGTISDQ